MATNAPITANCPILFKLFLTFVRDPYDARCRSVQVAADVSWRSLWPQRRSAPTHVGGYLDSSVANTMSRVRASSLSLWRDFYVPPLQGAIKCVAQHGESESGRGQPQSKTLRASRPLWKARQVLDCGCPLPLSAKPGPQDLYQSIGRRPRAVSGP